MAVFVIKSFIASRWGDRADDDGGDDDDDNAYDDADDDVVF